MPRWIVSKEDEARTEETLRESPWGEGGALGVKGFYP